MKGNAMTDAKAGRGKYVATPVSVTFPKDCPNADYAGKTVTYAGRGRKPRWWEFAVQLGLVAVETEEVQAPAATDTPSAPAAQA
jgi:DNA-binding protein H-NS